MEACLQERRSFLASRRTAGVYVAALQALANADVLVFFCAWVYVCVRVHGCVFMCTRVRLWACID